MNRGRSRLTVAAVAGALALSAAGAGVLQATSASATPSATATGGSAPKGNDGTIKINGVELADTPRNEPHVGCTFTVAFYGYASGSHTATLTFAGHAPTLPTSGSQVILTDTLAFSGGKGLDASRAYHLDLSRFPAHPKQGVHVKLTVHVPGSKGADVKHKVFWVQPCTGSPTPTPTPTATMPGTTPTPTATSPEETPSPSSTTPTVGTPTPTPSTSTSTTPSTSPSPTPTSSGGGACTGAAASSPDCTTVSTPPHFTG